MFLPALRGRRPLPALDLLLNCHAGAGPRWNSFRREALAKAMPRHRTYNSALLAARSEEIKVGMETDGFVRLAGNVKLWTPSITEGFDSEAVP
jgi:hypothetical protein